MKISVAISLLILVAAALIGGMGQRGALAGAEAEHSRLAAEAAALGLLRMDPDDPEKGLRVTRRQRADIRAEKQAEAHGLARGIIAHLIELKRLEGSGVEEDEAMQRQALGLLDRMVSLDAAQLRTVIADIRASGEIDGGMRNVMLSLAITTLAEEHPEEALEFFTEGGDKSSGGSAGKYQFSAALAKLAERDPDTALEWVRANSRKHPDLVTDYVKKGLLKGTAKNDMRLAFGLITELGIKDTGGALSEISGTLEDMKARTEFLGLLREFSEKNAGRADPAAIVNLSSGLAKESFGAGSRWIAENKLTPSESAALAGGVAAQAKGAEKGNWIEWMGEGLSGTDRERSIGRAMQQWTASDHRAAGEWLAALPDGPAKSPAIAAFAETVAPHDPQVAAQWALTLPPGGKRNGTLKAVYEKWPQDDPARASFMAEHPAE